MCRKLWARGATLMEHYFRTLVDVLLGYYMLTRGNNRRNAELLDLFTFKLPGEGLTRYIPLIFTTREGKKN